MTILMLIFAFPDVSLFVDSQPHDGFHHTTELSHVFEVAPFKVISSL